MTHIDGPWDLALDEDWHSTALRCPACGSQGRFWAVTGIWRDAKGRPVNHRLDKADEMALECRACSHTAPFIEFAPQRIRAAIGATACRPGVVLSVRLSDLPNSTLSARRDAPEDPASEVASEDDA